MNQRDSKNAYYYVTEISTRWSDNDIYGHVNNVAYYSYFDTVVNQYLIEHGELDIQADRVVGFVVSSSCDYYAPIVYPQKIQAGLRVNKLGNKSVEYGVAIFLIGEEQARAAGSFTHVFVNRETGQSVDIPQRIRQALDMALMAGEY